MTTLAENLEVMRAMFARHSGEGLAFEPEGCAAMMVWIDALIAQARDVETASGPRASRSPPWGWGDASSALPP